MHFSVEWNKTSIFGRMDLFTQVIFISTMTYTAVAHILILHMARQTGWCILLVQLTSSYKLFNSCDHQLLMSSAWNCEVRQYFLTLHIDMLPDFSLESIEISCQKRHCRVCPGRYFNFWPGHKNCACMFSIHVIRSSGFCTVPYRHFFTIFKYCTINGKLSFSTLVFNSC